MEVFKRAEGAPRFPLPILLANVQAGFPSSAEEGLDFQVWGVVTYVIHKAC